MSTPSFEELEQAAFSVIDILKSIPEFADSKIAIIGGLALWKMNRTYRTTQDVDFIITAAGAPASVKQKLLGGFASRFEDRAGIFFYKHTGGILVQIDITPDWQSPYVPYAAIPIKSVQVGKLPYIDAIDLIVFKINSCGLRATGEKKGRDATDAAILLEQVAGDGSVTLTSNQKNIVGPGLEDVVKNSGRPKDWWKVKLGI